MLKKIGSNARYELEQYAGSKSKPEALGKSKKDWRDSDFLIKNFGYDSQSVSLKKRNLNLIKEYEKDE